MSQRGYRPSAMLMGYGPGHRASKHSRHGNPKHRAAVMDSFSRSGLRVIHPLAAARELAMKLGKSDRWAKNAVREARQ